MSKSFYLKIIFIAAVFFILILPVKIVNAQVDYSLSVSPTSGSAQQGTSISAMVFSNFISGNEFETISLIASSGLPSGTTASFSPNPIGVFGSSIMTIAVGAASPIGTYTITIRGSSSPNGVVRTTTYTLTVTAPAAPPPAPPAFNFSVSVSPTSGSVVQGSSVSTVVTASLVSGATQLVSFSASGLPSGVTTSFSPISCSPTCTSNLTFTASSTATIGGPHTITITGTGGGLTKTTTYSLTVTAPAAPPPAPPAFNFSVSVSPSSGSVVQGSSVSTVVTASLVSGATQLVSFSASGLPSGVTTSFSPISCSPTCTSNLTFTASSTATIGGPHTITITGTGGGLTKTTTYSLTVTAPAAPPPAPPAFNFSVSVSPSSGSVVQGSSVSTVVTASLVSGATQLVSFSASGLPSGVTTSFSPISCSPTCTSNLTFTASSTATIGGPHTITITGTGGGLTKTTTYSLTVTAPAVPTGSLSCGTVTTRSITVNYSFSNGTNVSLFRGTTLLTTFGSGSGSGSYTDSGLASNTSYTYNLRNGTLTTSPLLASTSCTTTTSLCFNCQITSLSCPTYARADSDITIGINFVGAEAFFNCLHLSGGATTPYCIGSDPISGCPSQSNSMRGRTPSTAGTYTYRVGCVGYALISLPPCCLRAASNFFAQSWKTCNVIVDPNVPTSSITSPANNSWQRANFSVAVTDSDTGGSGLDKCYYRVWDATAGMTVTQAERTCNSSFTVTVGPGANCRTQGTGKCAVRAWAVDRAGNSNLEAGSSAITLHIDYTKPTSSITSPTAGSWQKTNFSVAVSDSDTGGSGLASCQYRIWSGGTAGSWLSRTCNTSITLTVGPTGNCQHQGTNACRVDVRSSDNAGNVADNFYRNFSIDWTKPTSSITSPTAGSWQKTNFSVAVSDSDTGGSGLASCQYRIWSGGTAGSWLSRTCNTSITLTVGPTGNCRHQGTNACGIDIQSSDNAGNIGDAVYRAFSIDWTVPTSTITSPANNSWQRANFSVAVTDSDTGGSGLDKCYYRVWDAGVGALTVTQAERTCNSSFTVTVGPGANCRTQGTGRCAVRAWAVDRAGNSNLEAGSSAITLHIDWTVPTVGSITPTSAIVNTATTFSSSVSDNIQVSNCSLYVGRINQGSMTLSLSPCTSCTASRSHTFTSTGTFTMSALCSDLAGNTTTGPSTTITVTAACTRANPTVSLSPASQTGNPGELKQYTFSVTNNDSSACGSSPFSLTIQTCPSGWTCSLNNSSVTISPGATNTATTLSVTSPSTALSDTYTITTRATNSNATTFFANASATYVIGCTRANPSVSLSPASQTGNPGDLKQYTFSVTNNDSSACGSSPFSLTIQTCPSGWTCSLNNSSVTISPGATNTATTLSVTSPSTALSDTYTITTRATNSNATTFFANASATYVIPPPGPTCDISASPTTITSGQSSTLTWSSTNATTCSITNIGSVSTSGSRSVSPTSTTTYTLTCSGAGGNCSDSATVTVTAAFDFSLSVSPSSGSVTQGGSTATTLTVRLESGAAQSVGSFSCSGLPTGAFCSFSPASCTPTCTSIVTLATASTSPAGTYSVTISGIGEGLTRNTTYSLTVTIANQPPSAINLSVTQPNYCVTGPAGIFSWTFTDPDPGDTQSAYQVQVDNNSDFSSPKVDSGKVSSNSNSYATLPGKLTYNTTYYWRLKVWDSKNVSSAWILGPSFTTPKHAYPTIDFTWSPQNPSVNEEVQFTDRSTVFGGSTKVSWSWTFQDGNPATSSLPNPRTKFTSTGAKTVSLRVFDSTGYSCLGSRTVNILLPLLPLPEYREVPPR